MDIDSPYPLASGSSAPVALFPDGAYFLKVLRRQWRFGITTAAIILACGCLVAAKSKDIYKASVVALFDRRDSMDINPFSDMGPTNPETVEFAFQNKMVSPDFLQDLERQLSLKIDGNLNQLLRRLSFIGPDTEEQHRARLVAWFEKRLIAVTNPGTGLLQLNALLDDTPEKSADLAKIAMEMFIQSELRSAIGRISAKSEFLQGALKQARESLKEIDESSHSQNAVQDSRKIALARVNSQQQETELVNKIRLKETDLAAISAEQLRRQQILNAELQQLQARLVSGHPDIADKRREIEKFLEQSTRDKDVLGANLSVLQHQLWIIRLENAGTPVDSSANTEGASQRSQIINIAALSQKVDALLLEKSSLERQLTDDRLRTRLKLIKPSSFEIKPLAHKRLQAILGSVALSILSAILLMALREATCPLARDNWRISRQINKPILAQLSARSLTDFPNIGPQQANAMRIELSSSRGYPSPPGRALLAYRRLELAIGKKREGNVIFFAESGASDNTGNFFQNFANIIAEDTASRIIVIDCALTEGVTDQGSDHSDLIDAALGKCNWTDLVASSDQSIRAFDRLFINKPMSADRMRPLVRRSIAAIWEQIARSYDLVLIRSFPETHFIENAALDALATDSVVCIDAQNTTYSELNRTLAHLDAPHLRGLVLIGT